MPLTSQHPLPPMQGSWCAGVWDGGHRAPKGSGCALPASRLAGLQEPHKTTEINAPIIPPVNQNPTTAVHTAVNHLAASSTKPLGNLGIVVWHGTS